MPSFEYELRWERVVVAGVDEAGRGPLAGPVFAAAAIIDRTRAAADLLALIDDSKKLTLERREGADEAMRASGALVFAIAEASVEEIDSINILQATLLAMRRAIKALASRPARLLIDGDRKPKALGCPAETIIGGDACSYSIAAASILAKVARDRHMAELAASFPGYGWETNRGYGSAQHLDALERLGPTPHHRRSFSPVTRLL